MNKLITIFDNDHRAKFEMIRDVHWWGISVLYDYDFYRERKCLIVQLLCWRLRWSFWKE